MTLAFMARYANQQIWPDGMMNAPLVEVEAVADAVARWIELEAPKKK